MCVNEYVYARALRQCVCVYVCDVRVIIWLHDRVRIYAIMCVCVCVCVSVRAVYVHAHMRSGVWVYNGSFLGESKV